MRFLTILIILLFLSSTSRSILAQDSSTNNDKFPDDSPAWTARQIKARGQTLTYKARAGFLSLYSDSRELKGRMFYVSYTLERPKGAPPRPLTFAWNGGPGSPA